MLQVVPLPGLGAILAGTKNPHSRLLGRGAAQMTLVVLGSWPLIIPGAIGLLWAIWDAVRIAQNARPAPAWSEPTPDADPSTLRPTREEKRAARQARRTEKQAQREARRLEREERRAAKQEADETRFRP